MKSTDGLATAVGSGSVSVTFSEGTTGIHSVSADKQSTKKYAINGTELKHEPTKGVYIEKGKKKIK